MQAPVRKPACTCCCICAMSLWVLGVGGEPNSCTCLTPQATGGPCLSGGVLALLAS